MSRLRLILCRVEEGDSDEISEIASFDLPQQEIDPLKLPQTLDDLEQQTLEIGHPLLQKIMEAQWEITDQKLAQKTCQSFSPSKGQKRRVQTP